ncbi:chymotrypsin-like elastase family member 2A [Aplysia californica]|uniref:Chymotrypsin-like elastase family member 2A n=1 Tax=Aplysia californica TaxID=6500 RepID=A0ABM0K3I9_APLCA|nr:chymotrypsin-like elastase family member 2A [Aplysia californica]
MLTSAVTFALWISTLTLHSSFVTSCSASKRTPCSGNVRPVIVPIKKIPLQVLRKKYTGHKSRVKQFVSAFEDTKPSDHHTCGKRPLLTSRIIGGKSTQRSSWPWMVRVILRTGGKRELQCGGVLVSSKWVLTAAHCVRDLTSAIAVLADWDSFVKDAGELSVQVSSVVSHPGYTDLEYQENNDIALLQLSHHVTFSSSVRAICLLDSPALIKATEFEPTSHSNQAYIQPLGTGGKRELQCGGVLVSSQWVLTAAHCVRDVTSAIAVLTDWDSLVEDAGELSVQVSSVVSHPGYTDLEYQENNDIALLQLSRHVTFSSSVRAICLLDSPALAKPGLLCTALGWGVTGEYSFRPSRTLQRREIYLVGTRECADLNPELTLNEGHLCGQVRGHPGGSCVGDSGGPLVCALGSQYFLVGLVSFSLGVCDELVRPSVYTNVSAYIGWIYDVTGMAGSDNRDVKSWSD